MPATSSWQCTYRRCQRLGCRRAPCNRTARPGLGRLVTVSGLSFAATRVQVGEDAPLGQPLGRAVDLMQGGHVRRLRLRLLALGGRCRLLSPAPLLQRPLRRALRRGLRLQPIANKRSEAAELRSVRAKTTSRSGRAHLPLDQRPPPALLLAHNPEPLRLRGRHRQRAQALLLHLLQLQPPLLPSPATLRALNLRRRGLCQVRPATLRSRNRCRGVW